MNNQRLIEWVCNHLEEHGDCHVDCRDLPTILGVDVPWQTVLRRLQMLIPELLRYHHVFLQAVTKCRLRIEDTRTGWGNIDAA